MKVRCPECGFITEKLPLTHKCPDCSRFSHEWMVYDWDAFALTKRRHIKFNLIITGLVLVNLLAAITIESSTPFQWLFNILAVPAIISILNCRRQLSRKSDYEGHRNKDLLPWYIGFSGF